MWLIWLIACTGGSHDSADSGICANAPVVTYETFGKGFLTEDCQSCHSSTTVNRHDAPDTVTFDTVDEAWSFADRILARAAADPPTMPPMGGTSDEDRELLTIWLTCADKGT